MVLLINTGIVPLVMVYTLSIILLALGVVYLIRAIMGIVYKCKPVWITFCFIFAVLGITLGVLSLIFKENVLMIIYIVVGVFLTIAGIAQIAVTAKR